MGFTSGPGIRTILPGLFSRRALLRTGGNTCATECVRSHPWRRPAPSTASSTTAFPNAEPRPESDLVQILSEAFQAAESTDPFSDQELRRLFAQTPRPSTQAGGTSGESEYQE